MSSGSDALTRSLTGLLVVLSACAYHNTIYNSQQLFDRAEALRRVGDDSTSHALYSDVIRRTDEAYRARPTSDWAGEALFLMGRAQLRLGALADAESALEVAERTVAPAMGPSVRVYLAAARVARGDDAGAVEVLNEALSAGVEGTARAQAHLLRGRWLLREGEMDSGWWDLDRAAEADPDITVEAGLERLRWAVHHADRERAERAVRLLLTESSGGAQLDELMHVLSDATRQWGPEATAAWFAGVDRSSWDRTQRGRALLARARLLHAAGDTAAAGEEAWRVARSLGGASDAARLELARWHLARTEDIADAYGVRAILLPAAGHPEVAALLDAVQVLEAYTDAGLLEPLGFFAAAEVARDGLGADYLARGLFLAYAAGAPAEPWTPKALLAALEVSPYEGDRAWLRGRLEGYSRSPYVLAAHGGSGAGFEALEEELAVRLAEMRAR